MIRKSVGKKQGKKENLLKQYSIYDTCFKCPLSVYIDLVCNDNLDALIIKGSVPKIVLEMARSALVIELSELIGDARTMIVSNTVKRMYLYKSQMLGVKLAYSLIANGRRDDAISYLSAINERINYPKGDNIIPLLKKIEGIYKGKMLKYNKEFKKYEELTKDEGKELITEQFFIEQLATISRHLRFHLSVKDLTLAEYGAYIKELKQSIPRDNG